ncbi:MAG: hypothetical protein GX222_00135 [Ruminococcaceae bacterium]|nr:hypothetical protein [Oscillospiraceae bacterium]
MQENKVAKIQILRTLSLVWLAWFIGNLCANALFYLGAEFKTQLPVDLQSVTYHWGTLIYFLTVAIVGIASSHYFIKKWRLPVSRSPKKITPAFVVFSLIFFAAFVGLGIMAISEGEQLSLSGVFSGDFTYLISPLVLLIPTMIAYTLMWYGLFLQGLIRVFGDTAIGKILSVLVTSFVYSIYHFASINEIHSFSAMTEEILITFGISVVIGAYVLIFKSLIITFIANLALNFLIFSPVETFHTSPQNWIYSYTVALLPLIIYNFTRKKPGTDI